MASITMKSFFVLPARQVRLSVLHCRQPERQIVPHRAFASHAQQSNASEESTQLKGMRPLSTEQQKYLDSAVRQL